MKRSADLPYILPVSNTANQTSSYPAGTASTAASMSNVNARAAIDPRHYLPFTPPVNQAPGTPAGGAAMIAGMPFMVTRPAIDPRYFLPVGGTINQTSSSQASSANISESRAARDTPTSAHKESTNPYADVDFTAVRPAIRKTNKKHTKNDYGPISHIELETLLYKNLASSSQQQYRGLSIKMSAPKDLGNGLPKDIAMQILSHINSPTDLGAWTATSRQNYLTVHEVHAFRRVSGIRRDIRGISRRNSIAITSSLRSLLGHLAKGGTYDKLLLTPMSDESRLASGFVLMGWVLDRSDGASILKAHEEALANLVATFRELSAKAGMEAAMDSLISTIKFVNQGVWEIREMKSTLDDFAVRLGLNRKDIQSLYFADLETRREYSSYYHGAFDIASLRSLSEREIALLCAKNGIGERNLHQLVWELPMDSRWELLRNSLLILKDHYDSGGGDEDTWLAGRVATVCTVIFATLDPQVPINHSETMKFVNAFVADVLTLDTIGKFYYSFSNDRTRGWCHQQNEFDLGFERGRAGNTIPPDFFVGPANAFDIHAWPSKLGYTLGRLINWLDSHPSPPRTREIFQTLCTALNCEAGLNRQ